MRILRLVLWVGLAAILLAGGYAVRSFTLLNAPAQARARPVPHGDQEIAWINPSTSGSGWERFVAGVRAVVAERPELTLDDAQAFPDQTTAVPEIAVRLPGTGRLWFRWYKITGEVGLEKWLAALAQRDPAPLAFLGGGTSDRARDLALALADRTDWRGDRPLLLITTATAELVDVEAGGKRLPRPLMGIYPERSFRFCFSNRQMAEAVGEFIWQHPDLRPHGNRYPAVSAVGAAAGGPWASLPLLAGGGESRAGVHVLEWEDDPYSIDLANKFKDAFQARGNQVNLHSLWIHSSVGGYHLPNHWEAAADRMLLDHLGGADERQLLVLPCMDRPARRILRGLAVVAPLEVRELVAVSGDSIPFNTVYRDREIAWNVQDMPVPLVFFCHQNPVAWPAAPVGDHDHGTASAGFSTDDELFNADIARLLLAAAVRSADGSGGGLVGSANALADGLHNNTSGFFTVEGEPGPDNGGWGDRRGGKGEYVVYVKPLFEENRRVKPAVVIEVWTRQTEGPDGWAIVRTLSVESAHTQEGPVRGGF